MCILPFVPFRTPSLISIWRHKKVFLPSVLAGYFSANVAFANGRIDQVEEFSIASKSADIALIEFAKQSDLTILFPYEKVKNIRANALSGTFSIRQGVDHLLQGTGLIAQFSQTGSIKIIVEQDLQRSLLQNIFDALSDNSEELTVVPKQELDIERISVSGMRASLKRSVDIKHSEQNIVDVIQAQDIGQFPDQNLAESLQRITGVSIDRAEGEGQFVTVRGFGPQFNTVLNNGRRLASDNLGREFSFDSMASELVSGVTVYKSNNAQLPSGGIGSTIDIRTPRPFDYTGFKVAGQLQGNYDSNGNNVSPQGSFLISKQNKDKAFGWLIALSQQQRETRIDEAQIDGWLLNTDIPTGGLNEHVFVPRNYDQRVRFDDRTRTGGTLVLQFQPNQDMRITLDYLRSEFDVKTNSTSMGHWFTSSNIEDVVTDSNGTVVEFSQNKGHATDFHARTFDRPTIMSTKGIRLDWQATQNTTLDADLSFASARNKDDKGVANALSLIGYLNRSRFDHTQGNRLPAINGFESADSKVLNAQGQPVGVSDYLDPANGRAHVMLRRGWEISDQFDQFSLNGKWDGGFDYLSNIQFGTYLAQQQKQNNRWDNEANAVHCTFCGYFDTPDLPDIFQQQFDAGNGFLSSVSGHQNIPKQWLRHDGEQVFAYLEQVSGISFDAVKRDSSYRVSEKVFANYVQANLEISLSEVFITSQLGLRVEKTQVDVDGVDVDLLALTILDQTELGQVLSAPRESRVNSHYTNWLPNFDLKLELPRDLTLRLAISRSLTRPTMSQMSPSITLDTTRQGGDLRASTGNPQLQPFESTNFDFAGEWYYHPGNYLSVNYFRKKVKNFITSQVTTVSLNNVTDPSTGSNPDAADDYDSLALFDLTQPNNNETATVHGWELAWQHTFAESGFGVLANMTLVDSNAELDTNNVSQVFALTGLSDSMNLIGFYQSDNWQVRLVWNHRDGFLQSLKQVQGAEPTFVDKYQQTDLSIAYALNDKLSIFMEGINLTDEVLFKRGRYANQFLLAQDTGARYSFGIRGQF